MIYQSRPQQVEAIQWTDDNLAQVKLALRDKITVDIDGQLLLLAGKDGAQKWVPVPVGHWLVHQPGDLTDVWPVDPEYFASKYTEAP